MMRPSWNDTTPELPSLQNRKISSSKISLMVIMNPKCSPTSLSRSNDDRRRLSSVQVEDERRLSWNLSQDTSILIHEVSLSWGILSQKQPSSHTILILDTWHKIPVYSMRRSERIWRLQFPMFPLCHLVEIPFKIKYEKIIQKIS